MIRQMLDLKYESVELIHIPMTFSSHMSDMGKIGWKKIAQIPLLIFRTIRAKLIHRSNILYFPPAGPTLAAMLRDAIILLILRPFFKILVLHFHASGVSEKCKNLPQPLRFFFYRVYGEAEFAIKTSHTGIRDPENFSAKIVKTIYNAVADPGIGSVSVYRKSSISILYMAVIKESKGILDLLSAIKLLLKNGENVHLHIAGEFDSTATHTRVEKFLAEEFLSEYVTFHGTVTGQEKEKLFLSTDIFCFPTYFESESFGLVAVEAMSYGIPVVATRWRSLPEIIGDGEEGLLVDVKSPTSLFIALQNLCRHPEMRQEMGQRGIKKFKKSFTVEKFHCGMNDLFSECSVMLEKRKI